MVVPRTSSWVTGLMNSSTGGVRAATRTRSWQRIQRRAYPASEGHASHKASGDLPWAIGAAVVTIPSAAYLLQSRQKSEHGHDEPVRPDHSVEDAGQGTPETPRKDPHEGAHEVESGGDVDGVRFKGATSGGNGEGEDGQPIQGDVRKHIPDAKGGAKKRISSEYGKSQGSPSEGDEESTNRNFASGSPSDEDTASKQEGISNTDTKHSHDLSSDPDKSKKGEGFVETAKVKGPVDPSRPQAENRPGKENATGSQADT